MHQTLESIYAKRFAGSETDRDRVWQVLTRYYFQRWIRPSDAVLDLGAGYCEFINNIQAAQKYALDLNPATQTKAHSTVTVLSQDVTTEWSLAPQSIDVVFTSNFFEHLPSKEHLKDCLQQIHRVLKPGGKLLALGPNIRFCFDVYWDFFDHYVALSDRSLVEAFEVNQFQIDQVVPRFLPYTMKGKRPPPQWLVRLYLAMPLFWPIMGKQFLVVARKP